MEGLNYVLTYLDDILIISNGSLDDHLSKLNIVLNRLRETGLRVHAEKSIFCAREVEYLGYTITS